MKILFKTEGGFGFFPGLNNKLEIDTADLPEQEAENVLRMTAGLDLKNPAHEKQMPAMGADLKKYIIDITDGQTKSTWIIFDGQQDPAIQELLQYLKNKQKQMR